VDLGQHQPSTTSTTALDLASKGGLENLCAAAAMQEPLKVNKRNIKAGIRGHYASYEPALRGEIARYSLTHSNQDTVAHFGTTHGVELPESTVRGLRDKYLAKLDAGNVDDGLDFGQRGRPSRLGQYDGLVLKCVEELADSGRRVTSFLVMAAAKQVLEHHCPELLMENGGSLDLNQTWAKSFLRRAKKHLKEKKSD